MRRYYVFVLSISSLTMLRPFTSLRTLLPNLHPNLHYIRDLLGHRPLRHFYHHILHRLIRDNPRVLIFTLMGNFCNPSYHFLHHARSFSVFHLHGLLQRVHPRDHHSRHNLGIFPSHFNLLYYFSHGTTRHMRLTRNVLRNYPSTFGTPSLSYYRRHDRVRHTPIHFNLHHIINRLIRHITIRPLNGNFSTLSHHIRHHLSSLVHRIPHSTFHRLSIANIYRNFRNLHLHLFHCLLRRRNTRLPNHDLFSPSTLILIHSSHHLGRHFIPHFLGTVSMF